MTTNFSFSRLLQLISRQWFENARLYLFSVLALLGLMAVIFSFWVTTSGSHYNEENIYLIFITGLYISGFVFASMSFNVLGDKPKGTYWLSFPASHLEKLICVIFYSTIMFIVVYCACFFLVKSVAIAYVNELVHNNPARYSLKKVDFSGNFGDVFAVFMYGFVGIQAFYLLGSVYFSRYAFIMTTLVGAVLMFIFVYYLDKTSNAFFGKDYNWEGLKVKKYASDFKSYHSYELSSWVGDPDRFFIKIYLGAAILGGYMVQAERKTALISNQQPESKTLKN